MPPNSGEYKSVVGLKDVHAALVTQDDAAGYAADVPESFAPAIEASAEAETSQETQFADDQPYDVMTGEGPTKITLTTTNIPIATLAKYLGKVFDVTTGRMYDAGGGATPPDAALSFRSVKSNGSYRFFQYLKGKFSVPKDEAATKESKATPKPQQIVFTALNTVHVFDLGDEEKTVKRVVGDEDATNFDGSTWFDQVQVPGVATPSALALSSSVPVDDATGVSVSANLTLTYNNALDADSLDAISLLDDAQAPVEAVIELDATKKIVTINPDESLEADTAYTLVAHARDIYGQTLASVVTFTTAA